MGFRSVTKSTITYSTDLPPSQLNTHPSGILHATRRTPLSLTSTSSTSSTDTSGTRQSPQCKPHSFYEPPIFREEHAFCWIANVLHIESALQRLENVGYERKEGIVFIPYSNKQNFKDRFVNVEFMLELLEDGTVLVRRDQSENEKKKESENGDIGLSEESESENENEENKSKKRKRAFSSLSNTKNNMFHDPTLLNDAQREELHIEIFHYFTWLLSKYTQLEQDKMTDTEQVIEQKRRNASKRLRRKYGIDKEELKGVLDKLEGAFDVIPHAKLEMTAAVAVLTQEQSPSGTGAAEASSVEGESESSVAVREKGPSEKGALPFLEESLKEATAKLVQARIQSLSSSASSDAKKGRKNTPSNLRRVRKDINDFETLFGRLVKYKEKKGDCVVPVKYEHDIQLARFVSEMRRKKKNLLKNGMEHEAEVPSNKRCSKTLTAERLERLNSIGFVWELQPKTSWEDRFQEVVQYHNQHDRWPSQGQLGGWVFRQRNLFREKDEKFMRDKFPRLDEIGFEWVPPKGRKPNKKAGTNTD